MTATNSISALAPPRTGRNVSRHPTSLTPPPPSRNVPQIQENDWAERRMSSDIKSLSSFVWSIAETLRGDFKQSEYGKVILPFVVLRRLDCILEASKLAVLAMAKTLPDDLDEEARETLIAGAVGQDIRIYNLSRFTFATLKSQDAKVPDFGRKRSRRISMTFRS